MELGFYTCVVKEERLVTRQTEPFLSCHVLLPKTYICDNPTKQTAKPILETLTLTPTSRVQGM